MEIDLKNPLCIRTLSNEEGLRLKGLYPDLSPSPSMCPTCKGKKTFRWWKDTAKRTDVIDYGCLCSDQWVLNRFLLNSGIDLAYQRLCWDDMTWTEPAVMEVATNYLDRADSFISNGVGLILFGNKGSGKTGLASLILKGVLARGYDGYFTTFNALLDIFTSGWRDAEDKAWFHRRIKNAGVLVIDDPGKETRGRTAIPEALLDEVIRHRVSALRPTIVTTNLDMKGFGEKYGEYVMSLLHERARSHEFVGTDRRDESRGRMDEEMDLGLTRPLVLS